MKAVAFILGAIFFAVCAFAFNPILGIMIVSFMLLGATSNNN